MPSHRFFFLVNRARHRMFKAADRECRERAGISVVQLGALFAIARSPGRRQNELADELSLNESGVTGLVGRMEKAGLLERRRSEVDARACELHPTSAARAILEVARPLVEQFNDALTEGFKERELEVVARFLRQASERFEAGVEP